MPELPEVETVARQLAPLVEGHSITRLDVLDTARLAPEQPERAARRTIRRVWRSGKQVVFDLSRTRGAAADRALFICVHLRMTGRLVVRDATGDDDEPHLRARIRLEKGREIAFIDTRRFGTFELHTDPADFAPPGLEPLSDAFTVDALRKLIGDTGRRNTTPIKVWLLRQDRIVGIGNIYASEILHECGVRPTRAAGSLTADELARLHASTVTVLQRAIAHCGTTFSDFQDAHGLTGSYQQYLRVYDRAGEPCRECATPIRKLVQAQRSTFWCPVCQPARAKAAKAKVPISRR